MSDTDAWHQPLRHVAHDGLSEQTTQTPGMHRFEAISGAAVGSKIIWMGENHVHGGVSSAPHHHGESETGIYVVRGNPRFVFLRDGEEVAIDAAPGDYVYVPPFTPHREENPGDEEAVVVLARSTQEGIVVNLPSLDALDNPDGRPIG